jgi:hypothetical protein
MADYSDLVWLVLGSTTLMLAIMLSGINAALRRAGWAGPSRMRAVGTIAAILIGWFALAVVMSRMGIYRAAAERAPTIQYGIVIPFAIGLALLWRWRTLWRVIDAIPQHWLVGIQVFRVLGGVFLVLYAAGRMPGLFALPAGIGDVLIGASAPLVAWAFLRDPQGNRGSVMVWNALGILDLVVALATGFLTAPSPLQGAAFDLPNTMITDFPLILVPVFLVPFWILVHIASLVKLRRGA